MDDAAEPPTALATTATISTTGSNGIVMNGVCYAYGIGFTAGNSTGTASFTVGFTGTVIWSLDQCKLTLGGSNSSNRIVLYENGTNSRFPWRNVTVKFTNASHAIEIRSGWLDWRGGSVDVSSAVPTTLFVRGDQGWGADVVGVDLSGLTSGSSLVQVNGDKRRVVSFVNCKLGSSVALVTGSWAGPHGGDARIINSDSADTNYRFRKSCYAGDSYSETTIVRTGGATDGTTPVSRKIVSSANTKFFFPFVSDPIYAWNETTGSSVTVTVETVTDNVTLTDAEAWVEVEYLGTSGFPIASTSSDRAADILATPANQATSSETWTTTGLSTPVKQKLSVTFTPQEKGMLIVRVCLAKPSTTMYFCPKVIDNADGKELMVLSPAFINQYDEADPPDPPASNGNFLPLLSLAPERTWEGVDRNPRYSPFAILGALGP